MGNHISNYSPPQWPQKPQPPKTDPAETFRFHDQFDEVSSNGLYLNDIYLPEEIISTIVSYIDPKELLKASQVCKLWCNIIKSDAFWSDIYSRKYKKKPKKLPWYVYYCLLTSDVLDTNLIKNGNGQDQFRHWRIIKNYGDEFRIEDPPSGADPLPLDVPEFNGKTSCFATSYYECNKLQEISFETNKLMQYILNVHKPHIYASEWVAGRFDCGCVYTLSCKLYGYKDDTNIRHRDSDHSSSSEIEEALHEREMQHRVEQWQGSKWSKLEFVIDDYPVGVKRIVFQHEGRDTQFWKGHYGSKMAGGVLKILLDSIEPQ